LWWSRRCRSSTSTPSRLTPSCAVPALRSESMNISATFSNIGPSNDCSGSLRSPRSRLQVAETSSDLAQLFTQHDPHKFRQPERSNSSKDHHSPDRAEPVLRMLEFLTARYRRPEEVFAKKSRLSAESQRHGALISCAVATNSNVKGRRGSWLPAGSVGPRMRRRMLAPQLRRPRPECAEF